MTIEPRWSVTSVPERPPLAELPCRCQGCRAARVSVASQKARTMGEASLRRGVQRPTRNSPSAGSTSQRPHLLAQGASVDDQAGDDAHAAAEGHQRQDRLAAGHLAVDPGPHAAAPEPAIGLGPRQAAGRQHDGHLAEGERLLIHLAAHVAGDHRRHEDERRVEQHPGQQRRGHPVGDGGHRHVDPPLGGHLQGVGGVAGLEGDVRPRGAAAGTRPARGARSSGRR